VVIIKKVVLNMDEQKKYEVIKNLVDNGGNKERAAMTLNITTRQVNRLINIYRTQGKAGFVHGNRNRRPANAIPQDIRQNVLDLYRTKYYDANFTHFTELLESIEGIKLSVSSVAAILEEASILSPRVTKAKRKRVTKQLREAKKAAKSKKEEAMIQANMVAIEDAHSRRPRCAYFGEQEQMDASPYEWFGGIKTSLHIAVDDATGMITGAYFDSQETLNGYYNVFYQILNDYGIPYEFLTDRRTVFEYKALKSPSIEKDTHTQFSYACKQLGTSIKTSSVPQAKGRVERMFQTLQSRLPVELRLRGITTIEEANEFLPSYLKEFNSRFALDFHGIKSVFERQPSPERINLTLAVLTPRVVDSGHCIQFNNRYYRMVNSNGVQAHYLRGTRVMVIKAFDGSMYCCVNDKEIYAMDEVPKQNEKSTEFDYDYEKPKPKKRYIPPMEHPWRSKAFWNFVKRQLHHLLDDVSA